MARPGYRSDGYPELYRKAEPVNDIRALTGRGVASGEVLLLRIGPDGTTSVIDAILIEPRR